MQTIVFRADASPSLGGGHVMRCLTLANELRSLGAECIFASTPQTVATVPALSSSGHRVVGVPGSGDAGALHEAIPGGCDWLVVDHYEWDLSRESRCRTWAENILVIDDLANRPHDCDILLDQNYARYPSAYAGLTPSHCRFLLGVQYALLRPEFAMARPLSLARRKSGQLKHILVSLGLTDPVGVTEVILNGVAKGGLPLGVDVAIGSSAPCLSTIEAIVNAHPDSMALHVNTDAMASLMLKADLCFGAAGTSSWERSCLGLPTVLTVIAGNQSEIAQHLAEAEAAILLGAASDISPDNIVELLIGIDRDRERLVRLADRSAAICDGRGTQRVAMQLLPERTARARHVWLRPAVENDLEITYTWQSQLETRRFGRNSAIPSREEHRRWFTARLKDPCSLLNIVVCENESVGSVRLDMQDDLSYEISIVVSTEHYGRGLGFSALALARRLVPDAKIKAEILPGNVRSAMLFDRAGYLPEGYGWRSVPPLRPTTN